MGTTAKCTIKQLSGAGYSHMLCHHSPELSHPAELKLGAHQATPPIYLPFPQLPTATLLLPVSVNLTALETSHDWSHTVFIFLRLAHFRLA